MKRHKIRLKQKNKNKNKIGWNIGVISIIYFRCGLKFAFNYYYEI
jgi:hypothetical protein